MTTLYLECTMGAAGDMLLSALCELLPDPDKFIEDLNSLDIPSVRYSKNSSVKCGITGTHIDVSIGGIREDEHMHGHTHHHSHTGMHEIEHIIEKLSLPRNVKDDALSVYRLIAAAESRAHGCEVSQIHFHEVGTMDAVADIVGVCAAMNDLNPGKVIVSPINVGFGTVRCAHGTLPVPAPATAHILSGVPIYSGSIEGELCTPTGAALIRHFADKFAAMPVMSVSKIGYGMGTKDFAAANCLRAMLGKTQDTADTVCELICNIDDMTAEEIGYATAVLLDAGALDVFTAPIGMKKNRPGTMLTCLCSEESREKFLRLIFKHTSTIGVREHISKRYVLSREIVEKETKYGKIKIKKSTGYGTKREKPEYNDLARLAAENDTNITEIKKEIL